MRSSTLAFSLSSLASSFSFVREIVRLVRSTFLAFSVFKLLLGFSEVESEVVSPGLLSLQLLLLSVQHLHGLIDGVSEGVKCLNLLLLNLPGLGLGLGEVTLQLSDTLFLSWRK